jgi:uncharacterized protein (DUF433 family)
MPVLMAFTAQQIARLARISERQLRYWEQTNVFHPTYIERRDKGPFRKIYSYRDVVTLRTLARLRQEHNVSLQELRSVNAYIRGSSDAPWTDLAIRAYGNHIVFRDPVTGEWMSANPLGQLMWELELGEVGEESEREARKLMTRSEEHFGLITRNRYIMSNRWVIAGTRIPVEAIVSLHDAGMTHVEIIEQYPSLVSEDIDAALSHAEQERSIA